MTWPASASRRRACATSAVVGLLAGITWTAAPASAHDRLVLASATQSGAVGDAASGTFGVSVSGDGSTIAFSSAATGLSTEDGDAEVDVYVKHLASGRLLLASTSASGAKASTFSVRPSLNTTGRLVAFLSAAQDLHPGDTDGYTDVFVKDLVTGHLVLASADRDGIKRPANSGPPDLSADGQHVAFTTSAALVPEDLGATPDVYVKELRTGAVHLASRRADSSGAEVGSYGTGLPSLSADGTRVAFDTDAALDPLDTDTSPDVYVKDLNSGELLLASQTAEGANSSPGSYRPSLSDDGRRVAFDSSSADLSPEDPLEDSDVYVKDLVSGAVVVASSTASGAGIDGRSTEASLSGDGRTVVFSSEATLGDEEPTVLHAWAKDLDTGHVELLSIGQEGQPADAVSISPRTSSDASTYAFATPAALLRSDGNGWADVYVRQEAAPPPPPLPPTDEEAPVLTLSATPEVLPAGGRSSVRITGSVTDAGSGLSQLRLTVTDEYGRVRVVLRPAFVRGHVSASWVRTVALPGRSRLHDPDGRDFTILATAKDLSGNTACTEVHVVAAAQGEHGASPPDRAGRGRPAALADRDRGRT